MHFCAIHLDDLRAPDRGEEEVYEPVKEVGVSSGGFKTMR
jgi:hypothetical protein